MNTTLPVLDWVSLSRYFKVSRDILLCKKERMFIVILNTFFMYYVNKRLFFNTISLNTFDRVPVQRVDRNQIKLNHHRARRKVALEFWPDRIKTMVSMTTDKYHRVLMKKTTLRQFLGYF